MAPLRGSGNISFSLSQIPIWKVLFSKLCFVLPKTKLNFEESSIQIGIWDGEINYIADYQIG